MSRAAMDRKARTVSNILIALSALCFLNYAIRLIPFSFSEVFGACPIGASPAACAWAEFNMTLMVQIGANLALVGFIFAREGLCWVQSGRAATRLTPFTGMMLLTVPLTVFFLLRGTINSGAPLLEGTRAEGLPLGILPFICGFLQCGSLGVSLAWALDRRQIRTRGELRKFAGRPSS